MAITDSIYDVWTKYTPAGIVYKKFGEEPVNDTINAVTGGFNTIKRYWYVPVIVGGVLVGFKILGSVKTASMLKAIATKK